MEARTALWHMLLRLWSETDGQDLIEYSLLLAFFAITGLAFLTGLRNSTTAILNTAGSTLSSATTAAS
jgi:Flp pilus assembly pilin Flp